MSKQDWTSPDSYVRHSMDFDRSVADAADRRLLMAFDEVAELLDEAYDATRSIKTRMRIGRVQDAMTAAIATQHVLGRMRPHEGVVRVTDAVEDICRAASGSPAVAGAAIPVNVRRGANQVTAEASAAWTVAAAMAEPIQDVGRGAPVSVVVRLAGSRLAISAYSLRLPGSNSRRHAGSNLLFPERLVKPLCAKVIRRPRHRGGRLAGLLIPVTCVTGRSGLS